MTNETTDYKWDFEAQKAETYLSFDHFMNDEGFPLQRNAQIDVDFYFSYQEKADPDALFRALAMFGYAGSNEKTEDDQDVIVVTVPGVLFSPDEIWLHEERLTKLCLARGFEADGWGFEEP